MTTFTAKLHATDRCRIINNDSKSEILTDLPVEYGGKGRSFSATDLVTASLGACILTTTDKLFEREGFDPYLTELILTKELSQYPKMIKAIYVEITHPETLTDTFIRKLTNAIATCPVKRSLNIDVAVIIDINGHLKSRNLETSAAS